MKLKVIDPSHPLPFAQMGVSAERMDDLFTVLEHIIDNHITKRTPRAVVLQDIAALCDTTEELLAVLDVYYSYLHENDEMYPR